VPSLIVTCKCGQKMKVPEGAVGRTGTCVGCGRSLKLTNRNTDLVESEARVAQGGEDSPPSRIPSKMRKRLIPSVAVATVSVIGLAVIVTVSKNRQRDIQPAETVPVPMGAEVRTSQRDSAQAGSAVTMSGAVQRSGNVQTADRATPPPWSSRNSLAPSPTAELDSSELEAFLNRLPELKDRQRSQASLVLYKMLLADLPGDAAVWILDMGQFIEDRRISVEEQDLLEYLVHVDDPLIYLASPRVMDGVTAEDLVWLRNWVPKKGEYLYLDKDLAALERRGLIGSNVRPELKALIARSVQDYEIRKGLYLIFNYGHPPEHISQCRFNTQLLMLCCLLRYGIQEGEERLAIAAALEYGSVLSVSDQSLWSRIVDFTRHRLDFVSETSEILRAQSVNWDPQKYPLQACIGLLWGARSQGIECRLASRFSGSPMKHEEFEPLFMSASTLVEIRDWLVPTDIFSQKGNLNTWVQEHPELGDNYSSMASVVAELCICESWELDFWHPDTPRYDSDWQWAYRKDCGTFHGACGASGAMGAFMMRSLNIAALEQPHGHWHYIPGDDVWRSNAHELIAYFQEQGKYRILGRPHTYYRIPWDNLHFGESDEIDRNRVSFFVSKYESCAPLAEGIPSGYVFRKTLPWVW